MGMSIDKAVEVLHVIQAYYNDEMQDGCMVGFDKEDNESVDLAIDTMRKYKKIEQIAKKAILPQYAMELVDEIREVIEDEKSF